MKMQTWIPVLLSVGVMFAVDLPAQGVPAQKACGGRVKLANIWTHLASLHDKNQDGKITPVEFPRGKKAFGNHDRNRDGVITAADFPAGRFWNGFGPGFARRADKNGDGKVSKPEWKTFVARLDRDGDGNSIDGPVPMEFGMIEDPITSIERAAVRDLAVDADQVQPFRPGAAGASGPFGFVPSELARALAKIVKKTTGSKGAARKPGR